MYLFCRNSEYESYFKDFAPKFESELKKDTLDILNGSELVRSFYEALVPGKVEEQLFWARYMFRRELLEKEEQRRKFLLARLNKEDTAKKMPSSPPKANDQRMEQKKEDRKPLGKSSESSEKEHGNIEKGRIGKPGEEADTSGAGNSAQQNKNADMNSPQVRESPESGGRASQASQNSTWVDVDEGKKIESKAEKDFKDTSEDLEEEAGLEGDDDLDLNEIKDNLEGNKVFPKVRSSRSVKYIGMNRRMMIVGSGSNAEPSISDKSIGNFQ